MLTSSGNRTWASHNQVHHYPFWTNLAFACKTKTLGSLHSHALLIIAKSSHFLKVQRSSGAQTEV